MSIKEIEDIFKNTPFEELPSKLEEYASDERGGVQKLIEKYQKKLDKKQKEKERLEKRTCCGGCCDTAGGCFK